jgi:hypothetical protein
MSECPEIVVYQITDETWIVGNFSPYVARLYQAGDFLPMIFSGDTPDLATAAAKAFWIGESAKIAASGIKLAKARNARGRKSKVAA